MALSRNGRSLLPGNLFRPDHVTWLSGAIGSGISHFQKELILAAVSGGREVVHLQTSPRDSRILQDLGHELSPLPVSGSADRLNMTLYEGLGEDFQIATDEAVVMANLGPDRNDPHLILRSRKIFTNALLKALERRRLDGRLLLIELPTEECSGGRALLDALRRIAKSNRDIVVVAWTWEVSHPVFASLPHEDVLLGKSFGPVTFRSEIVQANGLQVGEWVAFRNGNPGILMNMPYHHILDNPLPQLAYAHVIPGLRAGISALGIPETHSKALDVMARVSGYSSWMAAAGARNNRKNHDHVSTRPR